MKIMWICFQICTRKSRVFCPIINWKTTNRSKRGKTYLSKFCLVFFLAWKWSKNWTPHVDEYVYRVPSANLICMLVTGLESSTGLGATAGWLLAGAGRSCCGWWRTLTSGAGLKTGRNKTNTNWKWENERISFSKPTNPVKAYRHAFHWLHCVISLCK